MRLPLRRKVGIEVVETYDLSLGFKAVGLEVVTWKMGGERQRGRGVRPGPWTGHKKEWVPATGVCTSFLRCLHFILKMGASIAYLYADGNDPAERGNGSCQRRNNYRYGVLATSEVL